MNDTSNAARVRAQLETAQIDIEGRLRGAVDPQEREALELTLRQLNAAIDSNNQADLLTAATDVAHAVDALNNALSKSRPPFDTFVDSLMMDARDLASAVAQMQGVDRLPPAAIATTRTPAIIASTSTLPKTINSRKFNDLEAEYDTLFNACTADKARRSNIDFYVNRLKQHKQIYATLGAELDIPWYFIGIVHGMEGGFDFSTHLHNGDPLTARTKQVPVGRPVAGNPPFTWFESARDALQMKKFDQIGLANWSIAFVLYTLEAYNGFGYRRFGIPSPYLWSFSNLYVKGKFVADGKFDPQAVSKQCGAAVVLHEMQKSNLLA